MVLPNMLNVAPSEILLVVFFFFFFFLYLLFKAYLIFLLVAFASLSAKEEAKNAAGRL